MLRPTRLVDPRASSWRRRQSRPGSSMVDANTLGLALSVGGSRAAAFHCGTVAALEELNLLEKVNVVSAVSGGRVLCHGLTLEKLPVKPILCLNTSVLMRSATGLETER